MRGRVVSEFVLHAPFVAGAVDSHGNETEAYGPGRIVGIFAFDPGSSSEPRLPGQDRVVTEPTLYLPAGVLLGSRDQVTVRGLLYECEGETSDWVHPTDRSRRGGVQTLRRVTG